MKRARSLHSAANRAVMRALKDTRQLGVANGRRSWHRYDIPDPTPISCHSWSYTNIVTLMILHQYCDINDPTPILWHSIIHTNIVTFMILHNNIMKFTIIYQYNIRDLEPVWPSWSAFRTRGILHEYVVLHMRTIGLFDRMHNAKYSYSCIRRFVSECRL